MIEEAPFDKQKPACTTIAAYTCRAESPAEAGDAVVHTKCAQATPRAPDDTLALMMASAPPAQVTLEVEL